MWTVEQHIMIRMREKINSDDSWPLTSAQIQMAQRSIQSASFEFVSYWILNIHLLKWILTLLLLVLFDRKKQKRIIQFDFDCSIELNQWIMVSFYDFRTKCAERSALYCMLIKIRIVYSKHALLCIHTI